MIQQIHTRGLKLKNKRTSNILITLFLFGLTLVASMLAYKYYDVPITQTILDCPSFQQIVIQVIRYSSFFSKTISKIITKPQKIEKDIINEPNFADMFGGAMILTKSSEARNTRNILMGDDDKYMYMERKLPIYFVIGLKEEIAVSKIAVKSRQMYSSIVKHFTVEGSFSFPTENWTHLGTFKAKNTFDEQFFNLPKKVVRYIKVTITTTYGSWLYFSLTQIKVFGDGIFADAVKEVDTAPKKVKPVPSKGLVQFNSNFLQEALNQTLRTTSKSDEKYCPNNVMSNLFRKQSKKETHQNIIVNLLDKINKLETLNQQTFQNQHTIQNKYNELLHSYSVLTKKSNMLENEYLFRIQRIEENMTGYSGSKSIPLYILIGAVFFLLVVLVLAHLPEAANVKLHKRDSSLKSRQSLEAPT